MSSEEWNALLKSDHNLAWTIWDACRWFLEDSLHNDWASMSKRERQARYAQHKAARALRAEAAQAKAVRL